MKKNTLVQLIIIYIGISAVYVAAYSLIETVYLYVAEAHQTFERTAGGYGLDLVIPSIILALFGIVIIGVSGSLSKFITERAGLDDSLTIFSKPNQLLSILIVITALSHLLDHLPGVITKFFDLFTDNSLAKDLRETASNGNRGWLLSLLQIAIPCFVIVFSKGLTNYFSKNIMQDDEEIVLHHETVEIDGPGEKTVE